MSREPFPGPSDEIGEGAPRHEHVSLVRFDLRERGLGVRGPRRELPLRCHRGALQRSERGLAGGDAHDLQRAAHGYSQSRLLNIRYSRNIDTAISPSAYA